MKNLVPTFVAENIFEIDIKFYKKLNISYIFCDLDNTLETYNIKEPSLRVKELTKSFKENNIELIIISNNSKKRVEEYAKILNIRFIYRSFKPFPFKLKKFIKKNGIKIDSSMLIGDQLLTDIKCANKLKIKSIYVNELECKNALITKINKFIESIFKKRLIKKNKFKKWRDYDRC